MAEQINPSEQVVNNFEKAQILVNERFDNARIVAYTAFGQLQTAVLALSKLLSNVKLKTPVINIAPIAFNEIISTVAGNGTNIIFEDVTIEPPEFPVINNLVNYPDVDTSMLSTLGADYVKEIMDKMAAGATGLDVTVEANIWTRAQERQELEIQKLYDETAVFFSSRGFDLPPGALSGKINEINIEIGRRRDQMSMEIGIEQAKLAQTNTHFILSEATKFIIQEQTVIFDNITKCNDSIIKRYATELEKYKVDYINKIATIEAAIKKFAVYADKYKTSITLAGIDVDAQFKNASMKVEEVKMQLTAAIKEAELLSDEVKAVYALKAESSRALASGLGQVAAAALTSVNASASIGSSGSAGMSTGYSRASTSDLTKGTADGPKISTIHQYINK
jgi:hypothetical protein